MKGTIGKYPVIILEAYLPGPNEESEIFSGVWNGDQYEGTWLITGKTSAVVRKEFQQFLQPTK